MHAPTLPHQRPARCLTTPAGSVARSQPAVVRARSYLLRVFAATGTYRPSACGNETNEQHRTEQAKETQARQGAKAY